jgi:hypothetical protein
MTSRCRTIPAWTGCPGSTVSARWLSLIPGEGAMRTWHKIVTEAKVISRARRNRMDALRYLIRRPALLAAMMGYETALLLSSQAENRLRLLAQVKASTLIGCPF